MFVSEMLSEGLCLLCECNCFDCCHECCGIVVLHKTNDELPDFLLSWILGVVQAFGVGVIPLLSNSCCAFFSCDVLKSLAMTESQGSLDSWWMSLLSHCLTSKLDISCIFA